MYKKLSLGIIPLFAGVIFFVLTLLVPNTGRDWGAFRSAGLKLIEGGNPFDIHEFFNAPWLLIPLLPFVVLPFKIGLAFMNAVSAASLTILSMRRGKDGPMWLLAMLMSYPVLSMFYYGQIDWLLLGAYFMPGPLGMLFFVAKPQIGIGMILYYIFQKNWKVFIPSGILMVLSFFLYGLWPLDIPSLSNVSWNTSMGWRGILIGIILLKQQKRDAAMAASPFLSPYVGIYSWMFTYFTLSPKRIAIISVLLWCVILYLTYLQNSS